MKKLVVLLAVSVFACCSTFAQESSNCTLLGVTEGPCLAAASHGSLTLIGAGTYLVVLDCSNPAQPQRVGSLRTPGRL